MKKFKFRFSYFILAGLVGFVLQIISFFSFAKPSSNITSSSLTNAKSTAVFMKYMTSSIILAIATAFIIIMAVGYLIGKKKEKLAGFNTVTIGLITSESVILITTLVYIIFSSVVRTKMFNNTTKNPDILNALLLVRMIGMLLSYVFFSLFAYEILSVKKNSKVGKVGQIMIICVNFVAMILMVVTLISSSSNKAFSMLTELYPISSFPPYEGLVPNPNGFTLAQFRRLTFVFDECSYKVIKNSQVFTVGASIALISQMTYLVTIVVNIFAFLVQLVESFDIERDDNLMEI